MNSETFGKGLAENVDMDKKEKDTGKNRAIR